MVCTQTDCNGPLDAPPNQVTQHQLSSVSMSSPTDVDIICICDQSGVCEIPPIMISPCGSDTSPFTCIDIDCQSNTIYVEWWIGTGSSDFNILIRY